MQSVALRNFEDDMLGHMTEFFPTQRRAFGEAHARLVIRHIIDRAFRLGFVIERDACLYLTNALMLGSNFDEDLMLPWAKMILDDSAGGSPSARIDRLTERAMDYVDRLAGEDNSWLTSALGCIQRDLDRFSREPIEDFKEEMLCRLPALFPSKFNYVGEDITRSVIAHAELTARRYGLTTPRGTALYCATAFVVGSSFDRDPQLQRIGEALRNGAEKSPQERAERLLSAALWYLNTWLLHNPEAVTENG